jgi:hypothetical protein
MFTLDPQSGDEGIEGSFLICKGSQLFFQGSLSQVYGVVRRGSNPSYNTRDKVKAEEEKTEKKDDLPSRIKSSFKSPEMKINCLKERHATN